MFLTTSIAGRSEIKSEILYDGEVCLLANKQCRVLSISSCFVYEMQFETRQISNSVLLEVEFIVEITYAYLDDSGVTRKDIKKLTCQQSLFPNIPNLSERLLGNDKLFVIPVISSIAYRYAIPGDGPLIRLTLSASLEYIATIKYYSNLFECGKEQPESSQKIEPINWQSVFENIKLDDVLTFFEYLVRLMKINHLFRAPEQNQAGIEEADSCMKEENCKLKAIHRTLEDKIQSDRDIILHLQSELRDREDIISKLLILLDRVDRE